MRGSCPAKANPERSLKMIGHWVLPWPMILSLCFQTLTNSNKEGHFFEMLFFFLLRQSLIHRASHPTSTQLLAWLVVLGTALVLARPLPALCSTLQGPSTLKKPQRAAVEPPF